MSQCDACLGSYVCASCVGLGIRNVGAAEWPPCSDCAGTGRCARCRPTGWDPIPPRPAELAPAD